MKKLSFYLSLVIILAIACSKSSEDTSNPGSPDPGTGPTGALIEAGYGPSVQPFTSAWNLPAGVELTDSIHEYSYCWAFPPSVIVPQKEWKGVPVGFPFCLSLINKTNTPITIVFPPELIFASSSLLNQGVLVIEMGSVKLEPRLITTIVAQGFCINKGRTAPETYVGDSERFLTYSFGPAEIPAQLKEITAIVESKHISMSDILKPDGTIDDARITKYVPIQTAIWEVTDGQGLTAATRKLLNDL